MTQPSLSDIVNDAPKPTKAPVAKPTPKNKNSSPKTQAPETKLLKPNMVKLVRAATCGNRSVQQVFEVDGSTRLSGTGQIERVKSPFDVRVDLDRQLLFVWLVDEPRQKTIIPFSNVDWIKEQV